MVAQSLSSCDHFFNLVGRNHHLGLLLDQLLEVVKLGLPTPVLRQCPQPPHDLLVTDHLRFSHTVHKSVSQLQVLPLASQVKVFLGFHLVHKLTSLDHTLSSLFVHFFLRVVHRRVPSIASYVRLCFFFFDEVSFRPSLVCDLLKQFFGVSLPGLFSGFTQSSLL